jgi:hypothetical protein
VSSLLITLRSYSLLCAFCLCVAACDGGFRVHGTIVAQNQAPLSNCTVALKGPPNALMCCDTTLSPPNVDVPFTVAPSKIDYELVLTCAGFQPAEREFKYGVDASPSKPLELGVVTLRPSANSHARANAAVSQQQAKKLAELAFLEDTKHQIPAYSVEPLQETPSSWSFLVQGNGTFARPGYHWNVEIDKGTGAARVISGE